MTDLYTQEQVDELVLPLAAQRDALAARVAMLEEDAGNYRKQLHALADQRTAIQNELAAYMRDEMVKISINLSPAAMEGKIRDKLIQLGWTPPTPDADGGSHGDV